MSEQRITWAGRTLHGADRFGQWTTLSTVGWDETPETKGDEEERANADGALDLPVRFGARLITHTGHLHTLSHDLMHDAMHHFNGAMTGRHQVEGHGPTLWANARRKGSPRFDIVTDTFVQWQVQLRAVDPRKYGHARTFTAAVNAPTQVFHRGNYPAIPDDVIVRGDMPGGYTIGLDGWGYQVSVPLVNAQPHRIDYRTGILYVNGVITQNSVGNTNLTTVRPGIEIGVGLGLFPLAGGTGSMEMTIPDTYI